MDPTLTVLAYSSAAAVAAVFGVFPVLVHERLPLNRLGWSNALAAGMMLGAAYALMATALDRVVIGAAVGAVLGVLFVTWTHHVHGTEDLDLNRLTETEPEYGYKVLLVSTLHSAAEGVAIGAAMSVSLPFGALMAVAIAIHNIPESTVLCAILFGRGVRWTDAGGLAVATNVGQPLLAIVTFAIVAAAPATLSWALGFAVGALLCLVMVELLPESYRQAGHTSIALVTVAAMGVVIILVGRLA
jgi:ZIP family zinc transporter